MVSYGVVIPARNEEDVIAIPIMSLYSQTLRPELIVVVDDGSTDDTSEIASRLGAHVVRIRRSSNVSATGTPYLAFVFNKGFEVLEKEDLDFIMVSGAECFYPKDYVEKVVKRMIKDRCVIASGAAIGEESSPIIGVRGAGRLINAMWFRSIGFRYPMNYGFEAWIIFKALAQGLRVEVYRDVKFFVLRRTRMGINKAYFYGKAMKALGYNKIYVIARCIKTMLSHGTKQSKYMLVGYFRGGVTCYDDISKYVNLYLIKSLFRRLSHV